MDSLDDAELLRRYAEHRSEAAFGELVGRHLNLVYRAALRQTRGDTHQAEDIAQAVFAELARKAGSLTRHPRLTGWLYSTTHYRTSAVVRSERRRQIREQEVYAMSDTSYESNPGEGLDRVRPVLDEILRELGGIDREAVLLHFFEQRPFAEVGARLRLREDAARMRVSRALEKLRAALVRRGIASTTAALALMLSAEAAEAAPAGLAGSITHAALASSAVGSGTVAALLKLMSTSKMTLSVAAVVGTAAIGFGVY